ncbi:endothelin-converting enzyme-like 1 [Rhipicephalus sanguineus]|uniref:endothelin-converting enzyme-like 1 n=1 Tax=Rhipicephalus sanguineus TaxID=34632 RepID=UPI001894B853|nr:endothelin-converting enzyme-like 1 [Rhipicephalus sanguineus]
MHVAVPLSRHFNTRLSGAVPAAGVQTARSGKIAARTGAQRSVVLLCTLIETSASLPYVNRLHEREIRPYMIGGARNMVDEIRNAYVRALQHSTWLSTDFRLAAVKKIRDMVSNVGSPGRHFESDFVEALYKPYPDEPLDLDELFPTWIKALGLSTQYLWTDTTTPLYDDTSYFPFYTDAINDITVPTASMLRPFMYPYGILALNYGGLGTMIGGEMMRALDPRGIHSLDGYVPDDKDEVIKEYTRKALCLRKSHKSVLSLSGQEETLSEELDSVNLFDLVGTKMAYDAMDSLVHEYRDETPAGLNMSAQQLFFFNNCTKYLVEWLTSLNLDILSSRTLANVNPVKMMIQAHERTLNRIYQAYLELKAFAVQRNDGSGGALGVIYPNA